MWFVFLSARTQGVNNMRAAHRGGALVAGIWDSDIPHESVGGRSRSQAPDW